MTATEQYGQKETKTKESELVQCYEMLKEE